MNRLFSRWINIKHILTFIICFLLVNETYPQETRSSERVAKKADLYLKNPYPVPWQSPTKRSIIKEGYQLTIRKHPSLDELPGLLTILKKLPKLDNEGSGRILLIYCKVHRGFFRKKYQLELFDDCSIRMNNSRYQIPEELYFSIIQLMPLGLREHWQKYYACFPIKSIKQP